MHIHQHTCSEAHSSFVDLCLVCLFLGFTSNHPLLTPLFSQITLCIDRILPFYTQVDKIKEHQKNSIVISEASSLPKS